ncbi:hypothetical protein UY3_13960 [Chelonia mydas]|uniref:Uncharacterized protein n=1 Tax=Chelonia mydas TaxID=8469 RepID=M7AU43_CHEMY|nr:hypothetical protein UY3_13960 [Chelonia mydas]
MPTSNPRTNCLKCLGEGHQTDKCPICGGFKPRVKKERDYRLKLLLRELALQPQTGPAPVSLVRSVPPSMRDVPAPRKDPARSHQHRFLACKASALHQRRPQSPVSHEKKKPDRGRSPVRKPKGDHSGVSPLVGHPRQGPQEPTLSASAPAAETLSPAGMESPTRGELEEELNLPSTPDTYEAAHDLIDITSQYPAPHVQDPGLQTQLLASVPTVVVCPAPRSATIPPMTSA